MKYETVNPIVPILHKQNLAVATTPQIEIEYISSVPTPCTHPPDLNINL